jgi:hypothetical protein
MNFSCSTPAAPAIKFEVIPAAQNDDVFENYEQLISGAVENIDKGHVLIAGE